jgi:hypothetical protein
MQCSRSLNKLKEVIAVATVLATISCLVPESAQAIQLKFSGSPNAGDELDFFLNTSVKGENSIFKEAIQEVTYKCKPESTAGCPKDLWGKELIFKSGDLKAKISKKSENTVKYDTVLAENSNFLRIVIRVTSDAQTANSLLTSLEPLISLKEKNFDVAAVVAHNEGGLEIFDGAFGNPFKVTQVPDPDFTSSLLGAGAIGTVLLLNRIGHSGKLAKSRLTRSE